MALVHDVHAFLNQRLPLPGLVLLAAVLLAGPARAGVRPGLELGVNVSSLSYDNTDVFPLTYWDMSWRASFTGGFTLEVPFGERFALNTGLRYVQQGNRVDFDLGSISPGVTGSFRIVQDYVSLPVLLAFRPLPSDRFTLAFGPEFAVLFAAQRVTEKNSIALGAGSADIKDDLESTNISLDAAAGYEFPYGSHIGTLGIRYTHGLTGVAKKDHWVSDWKTQGIEALVGLRW